MSAPPTRRELLWIAISEYGHTLLDYCRPEPGKEEVSDEEMDQAALEVDNAIDKLIGDHGPPLPPP